LTPQRLPGRRRVGLVFAVASIGMLAALTLTPVQLTENTPEHFNWCVFCVGELTGVDFLFNIPLFIPLGIGLSLMGLSPIAAIGAVLATTAGIELLQLTVVSGRYASVDDIIANTLGGVLGSSSRGTMTPSSARRRRRRAASPSPLAWRGTGR
jgi:hypothetical protein